MIKRAWKGKNTKADNREQNAKGVEEEEQKQIQETNPTRPSSDLTKTQAYLPLTMDGEYQTLKEAQETKRRTENKIDDKSSTDKVIYGRGKILRMMIKK